MQDIFDHEFLNKLVVAIGEVSKITGVEIRKLRYWEQKGVIESIGADDGQTRRFNYQNIKKIILIKELLDEGYTLDAASAKVEARIAKINEAVKKLK